MEPRTLTPDLSVSPQISVADVVSLKALGYGAIVCHRPDGEGIDQPDFEEISQEAKQAGLQAVYQPVVPGTASAEQAATFATLCAVLPKPILAYCRTGTRSATLWALSQADKLPVAEILERAATAGFDLGAVVQRLTHAGKASEASVDGHHFIP